MTPILSVRQPWAWLIYNCGGIVGMATILDCVTRHESEWFTGRFGFVLDHQSTLPFRPLKGRLGFFYERAVA